MHRVLLTLSTLANARRRRVEHSAPPKQSIRAPTRRHSKPPPNAWINAYNTGDVEKMVALYADDGVLMPPHAAVANGKAAIRAFLTSDTAGANAAGIKLVNGSSTAGVVAETGWEAGSYTVTDASGASVDSGSYLSVSRKVPGSAPQLAAEDALAVTLVYAR